MIETIDCDYTMPRFAAAYLLIHEGKAAFIDNNTAHAVPIMLKALEEHGLTPDDVELCIITHIHLDHAGGSSALMKACPNATLVAHPRAAKHAIDPSKLVASAKQVYGDEKFTELYGEIDPIPESRVRIMEDGDTLDFNGRRLEFLHTRGHANHHFVIVDRTESAIFTGDAFGLCYPDLCRDGLFVFPSTSPTDFDGELARNAVRRIVETGVSTAYPTHFGPVTQLSEAADQMIDWLDYSEALMKKARDSDQSDEQLTGLIEPELRERFRQKLEGTSVGDDPATWERIAMDIDLNAQGLAFVAAKQRRKAREGASS